MTNVVVLGGGPAGLGAAFKLAQSGRARVTVLEQRDHVGGNAGSFDLEGLRVDYGSHRLHPACDAEVLADIRALLGSDLLERPRHGRIWLQGRWIHFPLKVMDLALHLPPSFVLGVLSDRVRKTSSSRGGTFASALEAGLGRTVCRHFYFPYSRKIWGLDPEELSAKQAQKRVSANSITEIAKRLLLTSRRMKPEWSKHFLYPRTGYGGISDAYYNAAQKAGADVVLEARITGVQTEQNVVKSVSYEKQGKSFTIPADYVWSTIPVTALLRSLSPAAPEATLQAAQRIDFRAMILIYLVLETERFSEYDAYYFPDTRIPITRLSEPKNFNNGQGTPNLTVLCAELPCMADDATWKMTDDQLAHVVFDSMRTAGLPLSPAVRKFVTRRLRYAYPIYRIGYEDSLNQIDEWISRMDGLLTFGRQGLFVHDNTHHALYMGYAAVKCLDESGRFDYKQWQSFRDVFETHVVED